MSASSAANTSSGETLPPGLPALGTVLADKYRLDRVIGVGGMGAVYQSQHALLNVPVAVKIILPEFAARSEFIQRFTNEAKAAARIQSDHITRVTDVGTTTDGISYLVMEMLEGEDLGSVLAREGPQSVERAIHWMIQTLVGLADAHSAGIVHRDLKPANLFLARRAGKPDRIKICDFGISKMTFEASGGITKTNSMLGSPAYMAPEQLRSSRTVDHRADIWSIGVILYEILSGATPFDGDNVGAVFAAILETDPMPLSSIIPDLPENIDQAVLKCLRRRVDERFADVAELAFALVGENSPLIKRTSQPPYTTGVSSNRQLPGNGTTGSRESRQRVSTPDSVRDFDTGPHRGLTQRITPNTPYPGAPAPSFSSSSGVHSAAKVAPSQPNVDQRVTGSGAAVNELASTSSSMTASNPSIAKTLTATGKGSSRLRFARIGAAAGVVLVAGAAAVYKLSHPATGPAPIPTTSAVASSVTSASTASPVPSTIRVKLAVNPPTARATIDGFAAVTPYDTTVPSDTRAHLVRVEAPGFQPFVEVIRFDTDVNLDVVLAPIAGTPTPTSTSTSKHQGNAGAAVRPTATAITPVVSARPSATAENPQPVTTAPLQGLPSTTNKPKPDIDNNDPWANKK